MVYDSLIARGKELPALTSQQVAAHMCTAYSFCTPGQSSTRLLVPTRGGGQWISCSAEVASVTDDSDGFMNVGKTF